MQNLSISCLLSEIKLALTKKSVNDVLENSLADELFAFGSGQVVNAVFLQVNHFATFKLELSVIGQAFDFDVERFRGFDVGGEVDSVGEGHPV